MTKLIIPVGVSDFSEIRENVSRFLKKLSCEKERNSIGRVT